MDLNANRSYRSLSLPVRLINGAGSWLNQHGVPRVSLSEPRLMELARRRTGLTDLGGDGFREGLSQLVRSANEEDLSIFGRYLLREQIVQALENRLRLTDLLQRRPELAHGELNAPIIIAGLPRSGTTHLHRLLCNAPDARPIPLWELVAPFPDQHGADRRRLRVRRRVNLARFLAPGLDAKHMVRADTPEECIFLFDISLVSISFWVLWPVHRYLHWYLEQDKLHAYQLYRTVLVYLQQQAPHKRLVLKAPVHMGAFEELSQTIPEARLVQTHREPAKVIPSMCSLGLTLQQATSNSLDRQKSAQHQVLWIDWAVRRCLESRERLPAERIQDVDYDKIVRDPVGTVEALCPYLGLPSVGTLGSRLRAYQADNPQYKQGKHHYSAADFGLDEAEINERYRTYRERFFHLP